MTALTLCLHPSQPTYQQLLQDTLAFGQEWAMLHVLPGLANHQGQSREQDLSPAIWRLACHCLLNEQACLVLSAELQTELAEQTREQLLEQAHRVRQRLGLSLLPLVLLAEASVHHSGNPGEAKGDVRQAVARLVRNGAEATQLLAYWLQQPGAGSKARLPNALKKGLSDALVVMAPEQLLTGPLAMSLKDLLCLVHARPVTAEQTSLYARILAGEALLVAEPLQHLAEREPHQLADLLAEVAQARLQPLRWLMLEREAETPELKQALRLALADALVDLPHWPGRTAILLASGEVMLARPEQRPALQWLDIGAMLAALAALANDCLLASFASQVCWLEDCTFPVETALRLRQADTGWGHAPWKALADLIQRQEVLERVLVLTSGAPDDALLASWQRYLQQVNPEAQLIWIDLAAEVPAVELSGDGSRMVRVQGWSDRLLELVPWLQGLMA